MTRSFASPSLLKRSIPIARIVVDPLAGSVTLNRYGLVIVAPIGVKSWLKRTLAPASGTASVASTWIVLEATGERAPTIANVAICGPVVSTVEKVETNG